MTFCCSVNQEKADGAFFKDGYGDVPLTLGMGFTRDRKKETVTTNQGQYSKSILERYGMTNCKPGYTENSFRWTGRNKEYKQGFQAITGRVMYLIQLTRYDIMYTVNQILRAKSNPSKAHMVAKHLIRYLAGAFFKDGHGGRATHA